MKNTSPCAKKQDTMYRCEVGSQWEGSGSTHEEFIFFLLGWGGVGLDRKREFFFVHCSQCVLIMFSWGFQNVPQDVPNFTSDLSLMVCPKFNNHVNKLKRWAMEVHYCFSWKDMTFYFVKCSIFPQSFEKFNVTNEKPHVTIQMESALYDVMHSQGRVRISNSQMPISRSVSLFKMLAFHLFFWIFLPWHPMGTHLISIKYHDFFFKNLKILCV
jgi:hypothetical protein